VGNEIRCDEQIFSLNFFYKTFLYRSRFVEVIRNGTNYYRRVSYKSTLTLTEGYVVKHELEAYAFQYNTFITSLINSPMLLSTTHI